MKPISFIATCSVLCLGLSPLQAENWPNWRGPNWNGATEVTGLPETFSKEENVRWVADLPGVGASTPAVWGDAVFVTAVNESRGGVDGIRLDVKTGQVVWQHPVAEGVRRDDRSTYAGPSPVTDGELVYFFTGTGELAAFDMEGTRVWSLSMSEAYGEFAFGWTFSTSPVLWEGKLFLQVLQRDTAVDGRGFEDKMNESYLLALNPKTGEEIYRHIRPSEAVLESREAFTTPTPIVHDGRKELLVIGGDALSGHDPETGKELWRWGTWNPGKEPYWRLVPSPIYGEGILLACAPKKNPIYAIKAGGSGDLSGDDSVVAWVEDSKEVTSDVPTPLYYQGRFYILNGNGKFLSCVEPQTGKILWKERLDAKVKLESSPTGADGKVYVQSHLGEVFVVAAKDEFELLHQTVLGEEQSMNIRASIVAANGALFVRTDNKVYCFSN